MNVVFILADDLGYHDLGATGSTVYETPNLDRLAAGSIRFQQGYAGSRVCSPSRATLLLGQYTATHGITDWIGARQQEDWRKSGRHTTHLSAGYVWELPHEATSLAEAFRESGYRTFFAGKWHLGSEGSMPTDHGFEVNVGGNSRGWPAGGYFDPYENPELPDRRPGENLSMRLADETKDFIVARRDTPFFAMLSFYAVHGPVQTTEARWRHYRDKLVAGGVADRGFALERRFPIRTQQDDPTYAGLVTQMDEAVGLVLDALDSLGIAEQTIVVFTSDNGGVASGDDYATSNLPLRGGKGYQWEGGTREPFFLRVGDRYTARDVEAPVTGADLYPTLLALTGSPVTPEQEIEGRDLTPLIEGEDWPYRYLYWHYPHYGNQGGDPSSVIRYGHWKLIHYWEDDHDELYHLGRDPGEQQDVAADHPEAVISLQAELLSFLLQRKAQVPYADVRYDAAAAAGRQRFYRDTLLARLEAERMDMLREDWQPNADWWGSR
ncbi:N-acetylgalactosamine-6-O-sulfatase [Neolewinella maritima]|uniref:N-acetylgalactosamine-6-O-sulfatase n=2 Tax=Neolewinella maritima TaxID=1383882 RepID=A0ABM9B2C4_9BACT|nr:N-acetylgalactosamine-6-O-sulfatase [Neolewinella maritima]